MEHTNIPWKSADVQDRRGQQKNWSFGVRQSVDAMATFSQWGGVAQAGS